MNLVFSIIIPVYNVEKYLCDCIDSVLDQPFDDFEIILVDDGATDSSPAICDSYAAKDNRIKVIHKENGGLSDARNAGINEARGNYLLFIDSDDFITKNSISRIFNTLNHDGETDVLFLNAVRYYESSETKPYVDFFEKDKLFGKSHEDVLNYIRSFPQFPGSACLKLVKRDLIIKNNIYFIEGILGEDVDWSIELMLNAKTYNYCDCDYYYYRQERAGAITYSYSDKKFIDLLFTINKWLEAIKDDGKYKNFSYFIYPVLSYQYCILLHGFNLLSKKAKAKYKPIIKRLSWLFNCTKDKRILLIKMFYRLFGLRLTSFVLNFYEKSR